MLLLRCCLALAAASPSVLVVMERPLGIDFRLEHSATPEKYLIETMPGGVALLDFDNDGRLDIFLVNGGRVGGDPLDDFARSEPRYWNRLYRQEADGSFRDVTEAANLHRAGSGNYGMGVATGDFDNDGYTDIYVTNYGRNVLYRNRGDGTFEDVTAAAGVAGGGWSASAGFFDFDKDGHLDLFVTRYLDWDVHRNILCGTPFHTYCRPERFGAVSNLLFRNEGNGRFRDVSAAAGIAAHKGRALGAAFHDLDGDGWLDIFVANDGMEQFLFRNLGNGRFEEVALKAGAAFSDDGKTFAGMGVAFEDYDNDGRPDVAVTNLALEKYAMYRNTGGGLLRYASLDTGLAAATVRSSGWGTAWRDFDNDGWKDLFVAQSHVLDNVERVNPKLKYKEPPLLLRNDRGRLVPVAAGFQEEFAGRGAAFGDLNNDGWIDVVVTALGEGPRIFWNRGSGNQWLGLKLEGTRSPRDGQGAMARVGGQLMHATTAGSYLSASDPRVHFGLGAKTKTDVEILWPSGKRQTLRGVSAGQYVEVKEP
jgi:enediyne biosynthesis protein E4